LVEPQRATVSRSTRSISFKLAILRPHVFEMRRGKTPGLGAWALAMVSQGQQGSYFVNGESERPGSADEGESFQMVCPVDTVAARASPGNRQ